MTGQFLNSQAWFSLVTQAQAQTQSFLFHRENGLDAGISTSTRITFFPFSCAALMLAFALRQVKTKYRSGITQAQGYLLHVAMFGQ